MSVEENKAILGRFIEEVINADALDAAGQFMAEEVVEQSPFPGQGPGLEGVKQVLRWMRFAFPDIHWTIDEQIGEGDRVVTRFTWRGTHEGDFLGVPATGRAVSVWGVVIDRLEHGRIVETRMIMDSLGLLQQLGLLPAPGSD